MFLSKETVHLFFVSVNRNIFFYSLNLKNLIFSVYAFHIKINFNYNKDLKKYCSIKKI